MKNKQRIIDKIKRCLALSNSSNENEAATALRQAHAMMSKHGIIMADVKLADITYANTEQSLARKPQNYQVVLARMIADKFGCDFYLDYNSQTKKRNICYVGIDLYSRIASYAFDVLNRQLKQARRDYIKNHLNRVRIKKNKYARADIFCMGWVAKVKDLISTLTPPDVDRKLIESKMQALQLVENPVTDRSKSAPKALRGDFANGWVKGKSANLHNAISSHTNQSALLEQTS